jgi:site-specific DNA-methyltransferase (adenine-specific)
MAAPAHVDAYGVEIDPVVAAQAVANTGRQIIVGDWCQVDLPRRPTAIIGNPPFAVETIDGFLARCFDLLENGGKVGFILPCYFFQTAAHVIGLAQRWSLAQEMIPRNIFHRLQPPLCFATFTKERQVQLVGFALYSETQQVLEGLHDRYRAKFIGNGSRAGVWRETVLQAAEECGGDTVTLGQLYACIEKCRPTPNPFWREKIRQVAAQCLQRVSAGVYAVGGG